MIYLSTLRHGSLPLYNEFTVFHQVGLEGLPAAGDHKLPASETFQHGLHAQACSLRVEVRLRHLTKIATRVYKTDRNARCIYDLTACNTHFTPFPCI